MNELGLQLKIFYINQLVYKMSEMVKNVHHTKSNPN